MPKLFLIGLGGFCGACTRYLLSGAAHRWFSASFPTGTLLVNMAGCLCMGALMYLAEERQLLGPEGRMLLMVGFLGSFTTFSSVEYETFDMIRSGQMLQASWNIALNFVLGMAALIAGWTGLRLLHL